MLLCGIRIDPQRLLEVSQRLLQAAGILGKRDPQVALRAPGLGMLRQRIVPDRHGAVVIRIAAGGEKSQPQRNGEECENTPPGSHRECAGNDKGHNGGQRQIHAVFRNGLRRHGHDGRGGSQDREEPGAAESNRRPSEECDKGRREQENNHCHLRCDIAHAPDHRRAIVEDQRVRPEREAQVVGHRVELGQGVGVPGHAQPESDGMPAGIRADHQQSEQKPGGGQPDVDPPVFLPGLPE